MNCAQKNYWIRAARHALEYGITIGLAVFSGYCIVQGRW